MPLMWAHAEYIKLLRSVSDGHVFDLIPEVADRYLGGRKDFKLFEIWKPNRQARVVKRGYTMRVQVPAPFRLHWTNDEWRTVRDTASGATALGIEFIDIPITAAQQAPIRFTFFWPESNSWEGREYPHKTCSKSVNQGELSVKSWVFLQNPRQIAVNVRHLRGQFVHVSFVFIHIPASNALN